MQLLVAPTRIIQSVAILHLWMVHVATVGLPVMITSFHVVEDVKQYHTGQQLDYYHNYHNYQKTTSIIIIINLLPIQCQSES